MSSVNKVILLGRLGKDPEMRATNAGMAIASISLATSEKSAKDKEEKTEWHRVIFFDKLAEIVAKYLKKGAKVYVEGKLQTNKWTDKTGQERYTTEIIANHMVMLDGTAKGCDVEMQKPNVLPQSEAKPYTPVAGVCGLNDDDIPF